MFSKKINLFLILSLICASNLDPLNIIEKSINRLNNLNIEFESNIKQQSSIDKPINYSLDFKSYWPHLDSLLFYNYIKFNSPMDYKDSEIWASYNKDTIIIKKRLPIDNQIKFVDKNSENIDIINLFNFKQLFDDIKNRNFSIKNSSIDKKEIFYIKAYSKKNKKKAIRLYIDKNTYAIYKIEWSDRRGRINKNIVFDNWTTIDTIDFSSKIIYEDIKNGSKFTCNLINIKFNQIDEIDIEKLKVGFNFE